MSRPAIVDRVLAPGAVSCEISCRAGQCGQAFAGGLEGGVQRVVLAGQLG